ncbi:hypothetical protein LARI1_G006012 [Lachnellula arida]|uniref:Xylanolytic transcriptional activator regulatory domain-containing protein n=1 Tax=Lachnellula arida TaxID=1316785 RepID=A0A8T9BGW0_9HELO|nr:hypothetical protein LARI1_G006012 [Lachnellula arida]
MAGQSPRASTKAKHRAQPHASSPRIGAPFPGTSTPRNGYASPSERERGYSCSGFFGSTSFSATIHEATNALKDIQFDFDDDVETPGIDCKMGANVLKQLPSLPLCEKLLGLYETNSGEVGFPQAIVRNMFQTLRTSYPNIWDERPEAKDLLVTAKSITKNTHVPLSTADAADEWKTLFAENVRWEAVGILFCAFTYGILSLGHKDILFSVESELKMDRKKYLLVMKGCIEGCISICRKGPSAVSTLLCHLLYKNLLLETVIHGDSCSPPYPTWKAIPLTWSPAISVWRLHHDLVAMSTALGLHCYQGTPEVTIHSEMTKKLSVNCFWGDKEIAMFTGRPPALSRRYHSCPLPLDISDEALMAGGDALQVEIDGLDEHGWNTKGMMHNATISRMMTLAAMIQDEIMELFFGNKEQFSMDRVSALKKNAYEIYTHVPGVLNVTKESLVDMESDLHMWRFLFGRLDYLRIHFLLERLSHERGHEGKQRLLEVAREIADLTVFVWLQRDRSAGRHYDYDYIIMCYGMPSTGILCASLLKQTQQPHSIPATERLPTAEVVQILSLMISFLEWVKPSALGNYKLCERMAKVIRRVLDQVFEPPPSQETLRENETAWPADETLTWTGMVDEMNDWDWLNSIDWSRGPYMEFSSMAA